jgi:ribosomal-protein-alanine N-acetyltransferase
MSEFLEHMTRWMRYDAEKDFYQKHFPSLADNAELSLRPMRKSDIPRVFTVERSAYEHPWEMATFRDCFKIGYHGWIGEKGGQIVTYGILSAGAGECHLLNLCVASAYQGKGYGRYMLDRLIGEARRLRAETLFLEVRDSNRKAIYLYRQAGFNEIGLRKGYYPAQQGREDAIVMALVL